MRCKREAHATEVKDEGVRSVQPKGTNEECGCRGRAMCGQVVKRTPGLGECGPGRAGVVVMVVVVEIR